MNFDATGQRAGDAGDSQPHTRTWALLLAAALAFHAIIATLFTREVWVTSAGIGACLSVALAFTLVEARAADSEMRWRWETLALFFVLWILALVSIFWLQVVSDAASPREHFDALLYTLRGAPILLLLVRAGDDRRQRALVYLDGGQALLFAILVIVLLFPGTILGAGPDPDFVNDDTALLYHDIQNFVLASLAVISLIDAVSAKRLRLKRALAAMLLTYAVLALVLNRFVIAVTPPPPPGSPFNMTGDLPVVAFFLFALRRPVARRIWRGSSAPVILLRSLLPAAFCIGSLLIAIRVGQIFPVVGVIGAAAALALFATRSAYVQFELADLQQLFADVVAKLPDALCVVDEDGRITLANAEAARRLGPDLVGRDLAPLLAGLGAPSPDGEIKTANASLVLAEAALAKGHRIVRLTDISHVRQAERTREEALQFLSHDMRTPHAAIVTLLGMPGIEDGREGPVGEVFARVRRLARQGLALAEDFVRLARLREMRVVLEPVDLTDAVTEAVDLVWPMAKDRGLYLRAEREEPVWALADRGLVVRCAQNLLDNAVKFAPPASAITYAVSRFGDRAVIEVISEGPDLPEARAKALFKRFEKGVDRAGVDSLGLGLSFVHNAVEIMGGEIKHRRYENMHHFTINLQICTLDD